MSALVILAFLVGAVLAQRFRVLVIVPVAGIIWFAAIAIGISRESGVLWIATMMAATVTMLQLGYLAGSASHHLRAYARLRSRHQRTLSWNGHSRPHHAD